MKKTFAIGTLLCIIFSCTREKQQLSSSAQPMNVQGASMMTTNVGGGGNTWTLIGFSTAIGRREGMSSFVISGVAYVYGGRDATTNTYKKDLYRFNASTGTWTQMASMPANAYGRDDAVAFAVNGKGYIATGETEDNEGNNIRLKDLWEFNPIVGTPGAWTKKADLPDTARSQAAGFAINGKGYVGLGHSNPTTHKDMWQYDPVTNTWEQKADLPDQGRMDVFVFVCNNKAYMGGGLHENPYGKQDDMWEYDPATNGWTQKADYPGLGHMSYFYWSNGYSGFVGGGIENVFVNDFWQYSPNIDTWTKKKDFPGYKRYGSLGFYVNSRGYAGFGIHTIYTSTNDLYRYDP
jgi:N-acetylneuraminic acid mutarotase